MELLIDQYLQAKAKRMGEIMVREMRKVTPNTKIKVEGSMFINWNKKAKGIFGEDNEMKIWTPDIIALDKNKPEDKELMSLPKEVVVTQCQKPGYRIVWADEECKSFYGWQPNASILN